MRRRGEGASSLHGPVRVLFVDHAPALGGAEYSLLLLLRYLDRSRVTPILACVPGALEERARRENVPCASVPMPRVRGHLCGAVRLLYGAAALARVTQRERVDLLCANTVRGSLYAALASVLARRPLVWHVRDILAPGLYVRTLERLAHAVVAVSDAAAATLSREAIVVPNGVPLERFCVDAALAAQQRARWGVPVDVPVVGMVGRLRPWKGQDHFLRAMRRVSEELPAARFVVVGSTVFPSQQPYLPVLQELAKTLGIEDRVLFVGEHKDMPQVFAAMDLVVHCSVDPEPFGRVIIEAMAAAKPVVAYGWGGPKEIVVDGETGLLVAPGDHEALGGATLALLEDPVRRQTLGEAAHARAVACYDARDVARRMESVFVRVAKEWG